ncbi:MAG: NAD(P)-dependent alcohol dehydrogenase [Gammaproteobacteria bacterium]|nr:MAG: NAD(P)-dependent alcohol dehydrogenase [Gammaproteobacteria bacterium]
MRAVVIDEFGSSSKLELRDIPRPAIDPGQILVEVHAASVNPIDWKIREGMMAMRYGEEFPMVLGLDAAGVVVEVGEAVGNFNVGDAVYARSDNGPGRCYAEYVALNPATVAAKPEALSYVEAAAMPLAALTPLYGLRDCGQIRVGDRILLIGASGGVGIFATQLAKNFGAHVTAVCSGRNADLVRSLGADEVIDYTAGDVLRDGDCYDIIYDAIGSLDLETATASLADGGVYLTLVPIPGIDFFIPGETQREAGKGYFVAWTPQARDLEFLSGWVREGKMRPVIDSEYPLEQIRAAHERSQTLHAVGKIIIRVRDD